MASFLLRKVDELLWRRVKARAALDGVNLRQLLLWILDVYSKRGLVPFEQVAGEKARRMTPKEAERARADVAEAEADAAAVAVEREEVKA
jgi:hypothetical protein